ncbi:MAG: SUMF1/EgtB/PvdO family nonheme iron enzyme [Planctomycetes bacterium]|nr:SUMF1/EgtB/PvdO family nonheme iron enzyme [Planctomycetota bacterium]
MATQTKNGTGKVRVHAVAFGKHPGWDDHIEEIGLDSDTLVRVKRVMYTEGMAGNIDAGAWEKLEENKRLAAFSHVFYWKDKDSVIVGRLWSSSDGKGRTKYPMVVAAQIEGVPQWWAISQILPRLEAVEAKCVAGKTADAVRAAVGACRRELEDATALLTVAPEGGTSDATLLKNLASHADLDTEGTPRLGLHRILYEMDREMGAYKPGASRTRTGTGVLAPSHVRVPKCLGGPGDGARAWMALLRQELSANAPMLVIEPNGQPWLDIIVGDPVPASLFCVRANEQGLAAASRVPYTLPSDFVATADRKIQAWSSGQLTEVKPATQAPTAPGEGAASTAKSWVVPVAGVGLVALGVVILSIAKCGGGAQPAPPSASNEPAKSEPAKAEPPKVAAAPKAEPAKPEPAKPEPSKPETPKTEAIKPEPAKPAAENKPAETKPPEAKPAEPAKPALKPAEIKSGDDPRAAWTFRTDLARATASIERLNTELAAEGKPADSSFAERLKKLAERAELARAMPLTDSSRDAVRRAVDGVNEDLAAVEKDIAAGLTGVADRIRAYAKAQPSPSKDDAFARAWADAVSSIKAEDGWAAAKSRLAELGSRMAEAEKQLGPAATLEGTVSKEPGFDIGAIQAVMSSHRDAAASEAARAAVTGDAAKLKAVADSEKAWQKQLVDHAGLAASLAHAMAMGQGLDAQLDGGRTLDAAATALTSAPVAKDLGASLSTLTTRIDELRAISKESAPATLVQELREGATDSNPQGVAKALAAWDRLAAIGWPADDAGLSQAVDLAKDPIVKAVAKLPGEPQKAAAARAGASSTRVWTNYVLARGGTGDGLDKALAAGQTFGAGDAAIAALPVWIRYNLAQHKFVGQLRPMLAGTPKSAELKAAGAKFLDEASSLGGFNLPAAAPFLTGLKDLVEKAPDVDLSKLGPGAAGWAFVPMEGGAAYTWSRGGATHRLEFRRVEIPGTEKVAFLGSNELPVGLYLDAISGANKWDEIKRFMSDPAAKDVRTGPRVWVWSRRAPELIAIPKPGVNDPGAGWLPITDLGGKPYYSTDVKAPAPPSGADPMQYVSPQAAMFAARLVGCRLPTSEEWLAAAGKETPPNANLRDATWRKQYLYVQSLSRQGVEATWPAAGAFWPTGMAKASPAQDGDAATEADDGRLWFAPCAASGEGGGAFQNLVGNVAEYVYEDAAAADAAPVTAAAVESLLGRGEKVRVIGGSALSNKAIDPRTPQTVGWTQAREGFSDVGIRLAFSASKAAGAGAGVAPWKQLTDNAAYIPAPSR